MSHSRMMVVTLLATLTAASGCAVSEDVTDIMDSAERERFFSEVESLEATMNRYARRYHEAKERIVEYEEIAREAEDHHKAIVAELRAQNDRNAQKAKELEAAVAEQERIDAELVAERKTAADLTAAAKKADAAAAEKDHATAAAALEVAQAVTVTARKALEVENAKAADLRSRIEVLKGIHGKVSKALEEYLAK